MPETTSPDLRFPIGRFTPPSGPLDGGARDACITEIAAAPEELRRAVDGLSPEQLDTPYRPEGWTVRQVVHHVPDSHMNAYVRFKLALTEDEPLIKPYDEGRWAKLPDTQDTPITTSILLLESLHARWVQLLRHMSAADFGRTLKHPEHGAMRLDRLLALYAWHGRHHVAHLTSLRSRQGWS
ncbi:MAG: putative metal-dependent hydrolase [Gemmatimonadota bacterium]|nr:putative metal-dependent hydrolase [Gemmatimonadota bacterium]